MSKKLDRRSFLKIGALATGAVAAGPALAAGKKNPSVKVETRLPVVDGYVREPAREIPVVAAADVVVAGGGPAGFAAAVCAAREGASVLLIEKGNFLGGLWTGGEVLPVLATHGLGKEAAWDKAVQGLCTEVCDKLFDMGMAVNPLSPRPDPEATKYLLDQMIVEAGVRMLYHCTVCGVSMSGDRVDALILESKSGRIAVRGKFFVDCTGDGDVFAHAGQPFTEMKYHIGYMHRLGNADRVDPSAPGYKPIKLGGKAGLPSQRLVHMRGEEDQDGLDVFNLTRLQMKFRKEVWEKTEAIRATPGYGEVYLLDTATQLGVRVTRVLDAEYRVTLDESMRWVSYPDVIGLGGACDHVTWNGRKYRPKERPVWQIPYRALVPRRCDNLLAAGRCFSFDAGIAFDAREIGVCFVTGQAAGTAAAQAVVTRTANRSIDVKQLQKTLRSRKVRLDY